jgi:hypothetical protein
MAHQPPCTKVDTETIAFPWSDHDALKIRLSPPLKSTSANLWMMNSKSLTKETLEGVQEVWEFRKSLEQRKEDPKGWWDDTKLYIRAVLKSASVLDQGVKKARQDYLIDGIQEMWTEARKTGSLSATAAAGKLCILHKKDEPDLLKNYRPLTLMNCDYKIVAKALADRLKMVVKEVVGKEQTGFIAGRTSKPT